MAFLLISLRYFFLFLGRIGLLIWLLIAFKPPAVAQTANPNAKEATLKRISNGQISVGLKPETGGAIAWVAAEPGGKNLVNAHDRGRLIQQSYYGKADGSLWNKQSWRWNPVQGGD